MITKGAPDILLERVKLTPEEKKAVADAYMNFSKKGLLVSVHTHYGSSEL